MKKKVAYMQIECLYILPLKQNQKIREKDIYLKCKFYL